MNRFKKNYSQNVSDKHTLYKVRKPIRYVFKKICITQSKSISYKKILVVNNTQKKSYEKVTFLLTSKKT